MAGKYALIIGNSLYSDPDFPKLETPSRDAEKLAEILRKPEIGGFTEVTTQINKTVQELRLAINRFFSSRQKR